MTTYSKPELFDPVHALLGQVLERWHQPLHTAKVRIAVLMAASDDPDVPALKKSRHKVAARVRVIPLLYRMLLNFDVLVEIDEKLWEGLDEAEQLALLDHECSHLELVMEPESERWKTDDIGRPKLKTIAADADAGDAFKDVISRHGVAAIEYENYRKAFGFAQAALAEALQETAGS